MVAFFSASELLVRLIYHNFNPVKIDDVWPSGWCIHRVSQVREHHDQYLEPGPCLLYGPT